MSKRQWQGRRVVITGGSSGLGLALAVLLAARGARLALIARNPDRLEQARQSILRQVLGASVLIAAVDVIDTAALSPAMDRIAAELEGVDMLINSAGILREGYFEKLDPAIFHEVMQINYFGTVNAVRAALPHLKKARGGIVNIASGAGLVGTFGYTAYTASKYALVGFSESLRYELKPLGVGVQVICPTEFDSPMVDAMDASDRTPENRAHTLTVPKTGLEEMTRHTLRAIEHGGFLDIPGLLPRITLTMARLFPAITRWVGDRTVARVYRGPGN